MAGQVQNWDKLQRQLVAGGRGLPGKVSADEKLEVGSKVKGQVSKESGSTQSEVDLRGRVCREY